LRRIVLKFVCSVRTVITHFECVYGARTLETMSCRSECGRMNCKRAVHSAGVLVLFLPESGAALIREHIPYNSIHLIDADVHGIRGVDILLSERTAIDAVGAEQRAVRALLHPEFTAGCVGEYAGDAERRIGCVTAEEDFLGHYTVTYGGIPLENFCTECTFVPVPQIQLNSNSALGLVLFTRELPIRNTAIAQ